MILEIECQVYHAIVIRDHQEQYTKRLIPVTRLDPWEFASCHFKNLDWTLRELVVLQ